MDLFSRIREKARSLRAGLEAGQDGPLAAPLLLERACEQTGYEVIELSHDDGLLHQAEAVLDREIAAIYIKTGLNSSDRAVLVAHELGHLILHDHSAACDAEELVIEGVAEDQLGPISMVEGYGARERDELQANVFGREFLLPTVLAEALFFERHLNAKQIAQRMVLPLNLVYHQLCDALAGNGSKPADFCRPKASSTLNEAQTLAATHNGSPLLLEAGPGTGKTQTLVARIVHLLENGTDPNAILALTFSNKAAQELSQRVDEAAPNQAPTLWTGTFHGFGLELLRKYYQFFHLEANVRIIAGSEAIELLEETIPTLGLHYFHNLTDPASDLRDILSAISRAKDELIDAAGYQHLADVMFQRHQGTALEERAEKAREVAKVYRVYEALLAQHKVVDYGDLIMKPTLLLETQATLRTTIQMRYRHILVDEYQDVNRASARLLQALAGEGSGLWVVGDSRQSIYRFRGASSANMALFSQDFPKARRLALETNYRATQELVDCYSGFSQTMIASRDSLPYQLKAAHSFGGIPPKLIVAPNAASEVSAVVHQIQSLRDAGIPLKDQAILCRSNSKLTQFAQALDAADIPVLFFGNLFERDEIRDMLALLTLLGDHPLLGLCRVAQFEAYNLPRQDLNQCLDWFKRQQGCFLEQLSRIDQANLQLTAQGKRGLLQLASDLEGARQLSPWTFLMSYLFERSSYLKAQKTKTALAQSMSRLTLYQFLNFIRGNKSDPGSSTPAHLLQRIRQLLLLGEERQLNIVPSAAYELDAVRLMTIHASKGLEFEAVHLPGLVATGFPLNFRSERCPPPEGLQTLAHAPDGKDVARELHEEEEECLLYVALSRTRTYLQLYRSSTAGSKQRSPSKFLDRLNLQSSKQEPANPASTDRFESASVQLTLPNLNPVVMSTQLLEDYERCPRQFYYHQLLEYAGPSADPAFLKTQSCIDHLIAWTKQREPSSALSNPQAQVHLAEIWQQQGPVGHALEPQYREIAEKLLSGLVERFQAETSNPAEPIDLHLKHGVIRVEPDRVIHHEDGSGLLQFFKTGSKGSFLGEDTIHGLYQQAAAQAFGPGRGLAEVIHLSDGLRTPIEMTERKCQSRLLKADEYLASIVKGAFPTHPDPSYCPTCPFFFTCPSVP